MKILLSIMMLYSFSGFAAEKGLSNETEVSVVINGGNSQSETYFARTINKLQREKDSFELGGHYTLGSASETINVRNWDANARYDHQLGAAYSLFIGEKVQGDRFSGYETRYNSDLGGRYTMFNEKKLKLFFDLGYRYTIEKKTDQTESKDSKLRLYAENFKQYTETVSSKVFVEYLPNMTESNDWIVNLELSLQVALNKTLFLKVAHQGSYDNQPAVLGNRKYDYNYLTSLIAKF